MRERYGPRAVELWNHRDDLGLMKQLGAEIFAGAAPADEHTG